MPYTLAELLAMNGANQQPQNMVLGDLLRQYQPNPQIDAIRAQTAQMLRDRLNGAQPMPQPSPTFGIGIRG